MPGRAQDEKRRFKRSAEACHRITQFFKSANDNADGKWPFNLLLILQVKAK